jgi:hypothetical protein
VIKKTVLDIINKRKQKVANTDIDFLEKEGISLKEKLLKT